MRLDDGKNTNTFVCAIKGLIRALKTEKNLKFDGLVAVIIIVFGCIFKISAIEWIACMLSIGMMLFAETINTAVEATVDLYTRQRNEKAGMAKDIAAGAVLIMAVNVAIVGIIIFVPKIVNWVVHL